MGFISTIMDTVIDRMLQEKKTIAEIAKKTGYTEDQISKAAKG